VNPDDIAPTATATVALLALAALAIRARLRKPQPVDTYTPTPRVDIEHTHDEIAAARARHETQRLADLRAIVGGRQRIRQDEPRPGIHRVRVGTITAEGRTRIGALTLARMRALEFQREARRSQVDKK
jgi:hypothetical protein